jgi:adenylosuccinate synthase
MRAWVLVDLGFGDSGKGLLTDSLVRQTGAGVVVRYNGGAQAGHNVVAPDGCHHTFSQFGSGSFVPGVKTFLSDRMVVHPTGLLVEGERLQVLGLQDVFSRLRISERALIVTPFHQAANRIRELARGENRHGSCGVGVGETVEDAAAFLNVAAFPNAATIGIMGADECIRAGDLSNAFVLRRKLRAVRNRKYQAMWSLCRDAPAGSPLAHEWQTFAHEDVIDRWIEAVAPVHRMGLVATDATLQDWLSQTDAVVFEGAQGVLLDQDVGFHPYTTWSRSTTQNADELIRALAPEAEVRRIGVLRCFAMRHGPGPLPTETDELDGWVREHNRTNEWQGRVRYGWFDAVLAKYALDRATGTLPGPECGVEALAVTHLDLLPHLKTWKYCSNYSNPIEFPLPGSPVLPLDKRERLTQALLAARPVFETCPAEAEAVIRTIESLLGCPVGWAASGPKAQDVRFLLPFKGEG